MPKLSPTRLEAMKRTHSMMPPASDVRVLIQEVERLQAENARFNRDRRELAQALKTIAFRLRSGDINELKRYPSLVKVADSLWGYVRNAEGALHRCADRQLEAMGGKS